MYRATRGFTVVEPAAFQLEFIRVSSDISVLLNLTPDHLDRHVAHLKDMPGQRGAVENQTEQDAAIVNADDVRSAQYAPANAQFFGSADRSASAADVSCGMTNSYFA